MCAPASLSITLFVWFVTESAQSENEGSVHISIADGSSHSSSSGISDSSATANGCISEGCDNNNISCVGSFELSLDAQTDCEVQVIFVVFTCIVYRVISTAI